MRFLERVKRFFSGPSPLRPPKPDDDTNAGLMWLWDDSASKWYEVCDVCWGNCGQCGFTKRIGNVPANMQRIVSKTYET